MRVSPAVSMMVHSTVGIPDRSWTWIDRTRPATFACWRGAIRAIGPAPSGASRSAVRISALRGRRRRGAGRPGAPRTRKATMVASTSSSAATAGSVFADVAVASPWRVSGSEFFPDRPTSRRPARSANGRSSAMARSPKHDYRPSHRRRHSGRLCHFFSSSSHNPSFHVHTLIANGLQRPDRCGSPIGVTGRDESRRK